MSGTYRRDTLWIPYGYPMDTIWIPSGCRGHMVQIVEEVQRMHILGGLDRIDPVERGGGHCVNECLTTVNVG